MSTKYIASNWRLPNKAGVDSYLNDNYGLTFDGSEHIDLDIQSLNTPATISIWVNTAVNDSQQRYAIINGRADQTPYLYLRMATDNTYQVPFFNSNGSDTLQGSSATINTWFHFVIVCENSQTLLYENGVLKDTSTTGWNGVNIDQSNNWQIGRDSRGQRFWSGSISECAFFDYALSSTQISTLYGSSSLGAGNPMALKPAPVAFYPLGDNSSGNPLTQPNEAVEDASVFEFDGSSNYIAVPNSSIFDFTAEQEITVSAWVKYGGGSLNSIASLWVGGAHKMWALYPDKVTIVLGGSNVSTPSVSVSANEWHYVAFTFSQADGQLKHYLDTSATTVSNSNALGYASGIPNLTIGSLSGIVQLMDGQIFNLQIWNKRLTASEIETLYNSGVPLTGTQPQASSLRAWYKLDQSANWEADSSGAWQIPDAVSAYPQSFDFDGTTDCLLSFSPITLNTTEAYTISAWINLDSTSFQTIISGNASGGTDHFTVPFGIKTVSGSFAALCSFQENSSSISRQGSNIAKSELTNGWHHVMLVKDGVDCTFYYDGQPNGTSSFTTTPPATINLTTIGKGFNNFMLNGRLSNLQVWQDELSASQAETLYNNGVPLTTAIASDNLKAWYKLDNTATFSTNWSVPDASGNGNTGTSSGMTEQNLVNNNVSALNGESSGMTSANLVLTDLTRNLPYDSYSFSFDGVNDSISLPSTALSITGALTISAWVKTTSSNFQSVLIKGNSVSSADYYFRIQDSGLIRLRIGNANYGIGATSVKDGNWHHICVVYVPSTSVTYYVDGVQDSQTTSSIPAAITNSFTNVGIGEIQPFTGAISNLSIFDEALTSTEVMKLYSNGMPQDLSSFTPTPVAWWTLGSNSFFNGSDFICKDLIGSNDGTSVNAGVDALVGDTPRSEANGIGTNQSIPENLEGQTKYSSNNSWSINMSESARVADTP